MERFLKSTAVVTGASAGIGRAIVKELLKNKGLTVVGLARRVDKLKELEQEVLENKIYTGTFHFLQCDISKDQEIKDAFQQVRSKVPPIGILVNNAGVLIDQSLTSGAGVDTISEGFSKVFDTNLKGLLLCSTEALKLMYESGIAGHIININSVTGQRFGETSARIHAGLYSASKHAAKILSEALRSELLLEKKSIRITDIYPALVETELVSGLLVQMKLEADEYLQTEDIASACMYVLSAPPNVFVSDITVRATLDTFS